jgi:hypothetical protein
MGGLPQNQYKKSTNLLAYLITDMEKRYMSERGLKGRYSIIPMPFIVRRFWRK